MEPLVGFPEMISHIEGQKSAEILMEALGPNLRKLSKQCPGNIFSKKTAYMIIIQLVSILGLLIAMCLDKTCENPSLDGLCPQRPEAGQHSSGAQESLTDLPDRFRSNMQVPRRGWEPFEEEVY